MPRCCGGSQGSNSASALNCSKNPCAATISRPEKLRLIEAAREVEAAVNAVERMAQAGEAPLAGVIRLTSTDAFCHEILPPIVARMSMKTPDLSFELLCTNAHTDLSRLHADVTVRPTFKLPEDLYGEVAGQMAFGFYAAEGVREDHWLSLSGTIARLHFAQKMRERLERDGAVFRASADSFLTLRAMAEAGLGRAMLPCIIGDQSPTLHRVYAPVDMPPVPVFVASHADLADAPRLRQARARIAAALEARRSACSGLRPRRREKAGKTALKPKTAASCGAVEVHPVGQ